MTLTAHDLNTRFRSDSFKPSDFPTLRALLDELGIDDDRQYTFLGKRFPNDPKPISLIPESSLEDIHKIVAISNHIGG
jgi:hypothetical protein